jgi:REP element-mobilizing transposase RayT
MASMARPIRIEYAGAVYHVMARGNERRAIFFDDQDRRRFLETLEEMVEQFGVRVHAYCLMSNHYHLVVEMPRGNLSRAMGWLQVAYTVRFNRRHRRSGHLFQGRYKAQVVEADTYAQGLVQYVHLNPVRPRSKAAALPAERAGELNRYRWSSHRVYAGLARRPAWLSGQWLAYWGRGPSAHTAYRRQIAQAFGKPVDNPWNALRSGLVLGSEQLWRRVKRILSGKNGQDERRWQQREDWRAQRERLQQLLADESDRRVRMWARVQVGGQRRVDVARDSGYRDGSGVTHLIKRLEAEAAHDPSLARKLENLSCVKS